MKIRTLLPFVAVLLALAAMFSFGSRWASGYWPWAMERHREKFKPITSAHGLPIFEDQRGDLWRVYINTLNGGSEWGLAKIKTPTTAEEFLDHK